MNTRHVLAFSIASLLLLAPAAFAQQTSAKDSHSHAHDHAPGAKDVYNGYFEDSAIKPRPLSDWEGDWQSVYPYLIDGSLDPVMEHKAEDGSKSARDYRDYYEIGYKTDVNRIVIKGDDVIFHRKDKAAQAQYASDGYEILTYEKGNRGVRYIFKKTSGDEEAPRYIQFSDHAVAPVKASHYHLFWGNDRGTVLKELTNWPTYYPSSLTAGQIVHEMMEH